MRRKKGSALTVVTTYFYICNGKLPVPLRLTLLHQQVRITKAIGLGYTAPHPCALCGLCPTQPCQCAKCKQTLPGSDIKHISIQISSRWWVHVGWHTYISTHTSLQEIFHYKSPGILVPMLLLHLETRQPYNKALDPYWVPCHPFRNSILRTPGGYRTTCQITTLVGTEQSCHYRSTYIACNRYI